MDEWNPLQDAWKDLQNVPSYTSRFDPRENVHMVVLTLCEACGCWHDTDEGCPQMVEAA